MNIDGMQHDYDRLVTDLLEWINSTINRLNDRHFPNNRDGVQKEMAKFTQYRLQEKPLKLVENRILSYDSFKLSCNSLI